MRKSMWLLAGLLACLMVAPAAWGSGFAINEHSAKAVGMGGAFAAQADDATAIYFNPAGIVQLKGTQASAGFSLIAPSASFESNSTAPLLGVTPGYSSDAEDQTFFIPNLFATHQMNDQLSFGFGAFSNFGLSTKWDGNYGLRYVTGGTNAEVTTFSLNPVVAYKIGKISFSGGLVAQYLDITLENKIPTASVNSAFFGMPDGDLSLSGDSWDWGYNFGLLFWATDNLRFGASYRSKVKHDVEGDTSVSGLPLSYLNVTSDTEAELELPSVTYLGVAYTAGPFTFELDGQYTEWSSYDQLAANFATPVLGQTGISREKNWDDVWAIRFGVEYRATEQIAIRAGLINDKSPIPDETVDPLLPTGDRWLYCLGFGWNNGPFTLDLAYNYLDDEGRTYNNATGNFGALGSVTGEFTDVSAHIFMINASYAF